VTAPIKVDIWSDIACPWCYIGKRRFEAGSAAFLDADAGRSIEVEFHSFELSPDTPVDFDGSEVDFLVRHKGFSAAQIAPMLDNVRSLANGVGLEYDFDALKHTNTVKAHQVLHYASAHGRQIEMKERLLAAYFVEGRHVGRSEDLADLAAEVGLDPADVLRALESEQYLDAVHADQRRALELGIRGVPFYVIDSRLGVSGAQDPTVFSQVLTRALDERSGGQG
jgi:predicted DsbA family dithiol-disulfide isomerase